MSARKRIEKYRRSGGAADLVRVEVLVPSSARDDVLHLAERLRADHRNDKDLQGAFDQALALYRVRILDNSDDEYSAVKRLPADWTPRFILAETTKQMDLAETYIMSAPVAVVGVLSVNADGTPVEVTSGTTKAAVLRKATEEPDVMPMPAEFGTTPWSGC